LILKNYAATSASSKYPCKHINITCVIILYYRWLPSYR